MKVLLADDNDLNRDIQKRMLEKLGATVETAVNGQEALQLFSASNYDLVFLDCGMPVLDGPQAAKAMRSLETTSHTPILALTGGSDDQALYDAGMDGFVGKPVTMADLKAVLTKYDKNLTE